MDDRGLEASGTMCFHGIEYSVHMWVQNDELHVQVEEQSLKSDSVCDRWGAHFPSLYIEELTKKTGNFKRFYTFVNMLMSALNHKSESVFIDLLTYSDLELYRKRKMGKSTVPAHPAESASILSNNKRYLILTYAVEFDRVHYPLPLNYVENPSPAMLQKTIRRLKQALHDTRADSSPLTDKRLLAMQEENASLRLRIQQLQEVQERVEDESSLLQIKSELQASQKENRELSALYQQLRKESAKEIQSLREDLHQARDKPNEASDDSQYVQRIRQIEKDMERSKNEQTKLIRELKEELEETRNELRAAKSNAQDMQLKNRELLRQLAIQRTKAPTQTRTTNNVPKRRSPGLPTSDSENEDRIKTNPGNKAHRFKRFDPTAYHQERQQKLRARSQSPKPPPSPMRYPPPAPSGYSSDSSAGYRSGGSTSTKRSRAPRSASNQRETDNRLSSPRRINSSLKGKSEKKPQSPYRRETPSKSETRYSSPHGRVKGQGTTDISSPRGRQKTQAKKQPPRYRADDSDSESPLQSFVDIDNRLNALQQFLRDTKQSKKNV